MDRRRVIWTFSIIIAGFSHVKSEGATVADVPIREIAAKVGSSTTFTCGTYGVPIFVCLFERLSENKLTISFTSQAVNTGKTTAPGYEATGPGFQSGTCGLHIKEVKDDDNGIWDCKLITEEGKTFQGSVHLDILKKPSQPEFSNTIQTIQNLVDTDTANNQKVTVTCGSHGGQPPPKFKWFIGDEEITEGLGPYTNLTFNSKFYTSQDLVGYKFTAEDNGKDLKCMVVHDALSDSDPKEVSEKINVQFSPRSESPVKPLFVPTLGKDATLVVNISSNPMPQITWKVGEDVINPTQSTLKYMAYNLVPVTEGVWAAGFLIKNVEEEDLEKHYYLEAKNDVGEQTFDLRISSSDTEAGGLSAGGIIGLVLGIPALLIIIAVIVVYTRARGLLCFKGDDGTSSEKERMDGESGGTEPVVEEKPASQRLSARLSAIYGNLVAKKKDKGSVPAEEDAKEKEVTTPEKAPEKKPEDIVYAELDLVNETGGKQVVRTDDKTEYAEIVGVLPQGATIDETTKDKSPTDSPNGSPKK